MFNIFLFYDIFSIKNISTFFSKLEKYFHLVLILFFFRFYDDD